ncbi:2-succinyl-5-enolpyruvyl-6-hydroxy-3-cyclohexene-1-carboxylic-acid synthase [Fibrella aquatica]|uniref:2-succinyl-5-enolpyruvyl-6-hydroxy-3- cyclohexene-1-carboxylic-acid synthase n=1 Tax=Fibrella aquatica TaxID=3242487 RepID=UPI003522E80F
MPTLQPILNFVELLHQKGLRDVVVSPGSRSAPLTLAVARHPGLRVRVVPDERVAGFTALGMAQQTKTPVALICTSGSAVYNLSPAVVEAYFKQVPLLLLTADRPHEWLHQQDGQTIDQVGIFGNHVKRSYDFPADYTHPDARWFMERVANEAFDLSCHGPAGPVHINVPLREPFYPKADEVFRPERGRVVEQLPTLAQLPADTWHRLLADWERAERKLILVGQTTFQPDLQQVLAQIGRELNVPVVGEIISNLGRNDVFISQSDTILGQPNEEELANLRPDLLVTLGNSFLTRNLKTYFRRYSAAQHWHIQAHGDRLVDSFQSMTTRIPMEPADFFQKLFADLDYQHFREGVEEDDEEAEYLTAWQAAEQAARRIVAQSLRESPFTDWVATEAVLDALPAESHLHLGNSMPVRYANMCGLDANQAIRVWANRGTSGIDGCLSTAVGAALRTEQIVTVLLGDVSFFYDRNALWQSNLPANLRIVMLNNSAGHIFRIIDGPSQQPELETYFETPHQLTAERTCADFGITYHQVAELGTLATTLGTFFQASDKPKLLEITTDKYLNAEAFKAYKQRL